MVTVSGIVATTGDRRRVGSRGVTPSAEVELGRVYRARLPR